MNSKGIQRVFAGVFLMSLFLMADEGLPKREVSGQVFVVTEGGSLKLGLVGIHVVSREKLTALAGSLLAEGPKARATQQLLGQLEDEVKGMAAPFPEEMRAPFKQISDSAFLLKMGVADFVSKWDMRQGLFEVLPAAQTQTDADGVFTVEAQESDWLVARGERRAGGSSESYLWLMPLKVVPKKLLVANDNLLKDEASLAKVLQSFVDSPVALVAETNVVSWVQEQKALAQRLVVEAKAKIQAEEKELQRLTAEARKRLRSSPNFSVGERLMMGLLVHWIPAGRFMMGSPSTETDRSPNEAQHNVTLSRGFFLAETECTQSQWEAVMGSNPSRFKGADRPVEKVSWDESLEFCRKLTDQQRKQGVLPEGWSWRLPTEAEWEYAARAGTTGPRHGELEAIAWHSGNSGSETHPVKQKAANAWGLYDMIGNVFEWCSDWYGDYPTGGVSDPTGPNSGSLRVFRGGSWRYDAGLCRSASRYCFELGDRNSFLGFRPVLSSVR